MADNQMIKIEFDFDLGNVPASAKKFGEYLKGIQTNSKETENQLKQLGNSIVETSQKMNKSGDSIKKSNQQWTNFALILQDLPYGFRGIQNNIPAVIGGLAGMTGPIYLISSAIIALFTAWDMGAFGATKSTNEWRKALKETNDEIRNTLNYTSSEESSLRGLVDVMLDVNASESLRNKALLEAKEAITKVDEAEGNKIKTYGDAIIAINLYSEALQQQQMQEVIGKKIAEITLGQIEKRNKLAIETNKASRGLHPVDFFMGNKELENLNSEILANETLLRQLEDLRKGNTKALLLNPFSQYNAKGGKKDKKGTLNQDTSVLNRLKAEQQLYKDDMFMKRAIGLEILNEEEKLSLQKAKFEGASNTELLNIAEEFKFKRLAIEKETKDGIQEINNVYADERAKAQAKADKEAFDLAKAAKNRELQNALDAIKIESDTRQKLHKKDRALLEKDLIAERDRLLELAADGIYTAEQFDKITDAMKRVDAQLAGLGSGWAETMTAIDGIIKNFINDSLFALGDSIGKALMGENINALDAFGTLLADAMQALGKQLIAYGTLKLAALKALETTTPMGAMLAIAAGIAAVAAGAALKSSLKQSGTSSINSGASSNAPRKFANGGIISGPTYGLMGEYPGAKSNPEVVAPLDKLKDLMGGGNGGTFLLRGQDLLLSVNRAQKASNLKGQSISLA